MCFQGLLSHRSWKRSWDSLTWAACSWFHGLLLEGTAPRTPLEKRGAAGQLLATAGLVGGERAGETIGCNTGPGWSRNTAVGGHPIPESHIPGETDTKTLQRAGKDHVSLHSALVASKDSIYTDHRAFMNKHFNFSSYCTYSSLSTLTLVNI